MFPALTAEHGVQQKRCRDDRDSRACDEEEAGSDGRAGGGRRAGRRAREQGLSLTGPDGLLKQLTKTMIETALSQEITQHLGYEKNDPAGQGHCGGNVRNGSRPKTVLADSTGQVEIDVPRDRAGTFEPQIVRKRQRRLNGVNEIVLSPCMPRASRPARSPRTSPRSTVPRAEPAGQTSCRVEERPTSNRIDRSSRCETDGAKRRLDASAAQALELVEAVQRPGVADNRFGGPARSRRAARTSAGSPEVVDGITADDHSMNAPP